MEMLSEGTSLAAKQMLPRVLKHFPCVFIIATIVKDRESDLVCKMGFLTIGSCVHLIAILWQERLSECYFMVR